MTYKSILKKASEYLKSKNVEDPSFEAGLLLSWLIKKDLSYIYSHEENVIDSDQEKIFETIIKRRGSHEPFAYITGESGFMDLTFYVNNHVLIPREDTEILVQGALHALGQKQKYFNQPMFKLEKKDSYRILDVGCGSGCISICLAKSSKAIFVDAVDISGNALEISKKNALRHHVENQINFINIDFLNSNLSDLNKYDIIVSNPPYIPSGDMAFLMESVKDYEPHTALEAGEDGLIFYRTLAHSASSLLVKGGILIVECGFNQGPQVREIFKDKNMETLVLKDLSGIDRVVTATGKVSV